MRAQGRGRARVAAFSLQTSSGLLGDGTFLSTALLPFWRSHSRAVLQQRAAVMEADRGID